MVEAYRYPNKEGLFIPLRNGQGKIEDYCWINESDYEKISPYSWRMHKTRYGQWAVRTTTIGSRKTNNRKRITIYLHKEILGLKKEDKKEVYHSNYNTLDNRRENLRIMQAGEIYEKEKPPSPDIQVFTKPKMVQGNPIEKIEPRILNHHIRLINLARKYIEEQENKEKIMENSRMQVPIIRSMD